MRQMCMIHSRIDALLGRHLIVTASPLVRVRRQRAEVAKMLRVDLNSDRVGVVLKFKAEWQYQIIPCQVRQSFQQCVGLFFPSRLIFGSSKFSWMFERQAVRV